MDKLVIDAICSVAASRFTEILDYLGTRYRKYDSGIIYSSCPIHGGDNPTALRFYENEDNGLPKGIWKCATKQCHKVHGGGIIGFVQGITYSKIGRYVQNEKAAEWLAKVLDIDYSKLDVEKLASDTEKRKYIKQVGFFNREKQEVRRWDISVLTKSLTIPSPFFLARGYSKELLSSLYVGDSSRTNRAVVPVFGDSPNEAVGFTARSIYPQCEKCNMYHGKDRKCSDGEPKWRHNEGFQVGNFLYNYHNLAMHNHETATIVESPGNVMRLLDAGYNNVVAVFGSQMTAKQRYLLAAAKIRNLNIVLDNDEAGRYGSQVMKDFCSGLFNVRIVDLSKFGAYNDVGDMTDNIGGLVDILKRKF